MYVDNPPVHNVYMVRSGQKMRRNSAFRPTMLRAWRKFRKLTLEEVAERLENMGISPATHASLSRLENGHQAYTQDLLEGLARIYQTDVANLLVRNPADPDGLWSAIDQANPQQRRQIAELAKTVIRTGT